MSTGPRARHGTFPLEPMTLLRSTLSIPVHYNHAYTNADCICMSRAVRTTLNIDDDLLQNAQALCGVKEKTALVREGLKALIERESARRLALLGGSEPQLEPIPRRQPDANATDA